MLNKLLLPYSKETFFRDYWEKRHLHITHRDNPQLLEIFRSLISISILDHVVTSLCSVGSRASDSIRMSQDGILVPSEMYWNERDSVEYVDCDRLFALFATGASIVLNRVDEY